ncbi:MAG: hypothetical protein AAB630_03610, partial [Patescibacteria group bacterium]
MTGPRKKGKWIMLAGATGFALLIFVARAGNTAPFENIVLRATTPVTATALHAWQSIAALGLTAVDMKNVGTEVAVLRE